MSDPTVFVIDDDPSARQSVAALVESMGLSTRTYASAEDFLEQYDERGGCLVTDVRMFGMSGLELQETLGQRKISLPVVLITAYARTSLTVRAMRNGAVTLLDKPYNEDELWEAICQGLTRDAQQRSAQAYRQELMERLATLTESERDVLNMMIQGRPNKVIARRLDVSIRTVENRRRSVFEKMHADSIAQLVRLVIESGCLLDALSETTPAERRQIV